MGEDAEKSEKALKDMKQFMKSDMAIKTALIEMAPDKTLTGSRDDVVDYSDKLSEGFEDIEFYFSQICKTFGLSGIQPLVNEKLRQMKHDINNCQYDRSAQKKLYQRTFSDMDAELLKSIKKEFAGYTMNGGLYQIISQCKTVNELLHTIHSYIMNNDMILQSMPVIDKKRDGFEPFVLYGEENDVAKGIFDAMDPETSKLGATTIVGFDNKTIMMVRDSGHALTLEIDKEPDGKLMVRYFIPKLCNLEMVNNLRGVNRVSKEDFDRDGMQAGTNGSFLIDNMEQFSTEILDFIEQVPTDSDMVWERPSFAKDVYDFSNVEVIEPANIEDNTQIDQDTEPIPVVGQDEETLSFDDQITEPIPVVEEPTEEIETVKESKLFSKEQLKNTIKNIRFKKFKEFLKKVGSFLGITRKEEKNIEEQDTDDERE